LTAGVALVAFAYEFYADNSIKYARNAAFAALVIAELLRSFGARSETRTILQVGLFSNMRLFIIVAISFVLQLWIHQSPALETLFETEPISFRQFVAWFLLGSVPLIALEVSKVIRQSQSPCLHTSEERSLL